MKNKWKRLGIVILIAMPFVLAACGSREAADGASAAAGMTNKGEAAPSFVLQDMDGNEVSLADFAGHKVYVKYWASWCPICLAGLDELNTLAGQDNDFKVITIVSPDYKGEQSEGDFKEWFKGLQAGNTATNITVLLDDGGKWARKFGIRGYPTSLYIGSDGVLVKSAPGHNGNDAITETFTHIA